MPFGCPCNNAAPIPLLLASVESMKDSFCPVRGDTSKGDVARHCFNVLKCGMHGYIVWTVVILHQFRLRRTREKQLMHNT